MPKKAKKELTGKALAGDLEQERIAVFGTSMTVSRGARFWLGGGSYKYFWQHAREKEADSTYYDQGHMLAGSFRLRTMNNNRAAYSRSKLIEQTSDTEPMKHMLLEASLVYHSFGQCK